MIGNSGSACGVRRRCRVPLEWRRRGAGSGMRPSRCIRSIATRQLMSFSCPLARRQWSRSHTTCERANRWRLESSAMMVRIRRISCSLNSRPQ